MGPFYVVTKYYKFRNVSLNNNTENYALTILPRFFLFSPFKRMSR